MILSNFLIKFFVNTPTWVLVLIIIIIGLLVSTRQENKRKSKIISLQNALKDCMQYNEKNQTLTLNARSADFKQFLLTEKYTETYFGYEQEKYVYTGATVGGVTMGGVHKTGGNYVKDMKTSKVQLMFYSYPPKVKNSKELFDRNYIKKIIINDDTLLNKAQNSSINKYLQGHSIIVQEDVDEKGLKNVLLTTAHVGNMNMASNLIETATTKTMPTKEKCDEIIDWLSSNN